MFTFQGMQLMIITFENRKVKLFEVETGHFQSEFSFVDSSLDTFARPKSEGSHDSSDENEQSNVLGADGEGKSLANRDNDDILTKMVKGTRKSAFGNVLSGGRAVSEIEKAFLRRKEQRDRGVHRPELAKMMEMVKAEKRVLQKQAKTAFGFMTR